APPRLRTAHLCLEHLHRTAAPWSRGTATSPAARALTGSRPPPNVSPIMDRNASFEAEALPHLDAVYRFALRLTGSPADAEDLVQETFLRAYRAWDQYTPGTRAKSWLFTICRNTFLRQRERSVRHDEILQQAASTNTNRSTGSTE